MDMVGFGVILVVLVAGDCVEIVVVRLGLLVVGCSDESSVWCGGELGGVKNGVSSLSDDWFIGSS